MSDHLQLTVSIFDAVEPVLVRPDVTVDRLFQDILREFASELDLHQRYTLLFQGQALPPAAAIGSLGLPTDAVLTLSYRVSAQSLWTSRMPAVVLPEKTLRIELVVVPEGRRFPVETLSALIGRYSQRTGEAVDIDLSDLPGSDTVSRQHARVSFDGTRYAITRLEKANILTLNGEAIASAETRALTAGDVLGLGEVALRVETLKSHGSPA